MSRIFKPQMLALFIALTVVFMGNTSQAKVVPKVDNVILFVDQSGSMYMRHKTLKETRMSAAKRLLTTLVELFPDSGLTFSTYLFSPFEGILEPAGFSRDRALDSIARIKGSQEIYGRLTSMGLDIRKLDKVRSKLKGRTAVIVVSDGLPNQGADPITEAVKARVTDLHVFFHVISLADDRDGEATLEKLSQMGGGTFAEAGELLENEAAMEKFVQEVLYEEIPEAPATKEAVILKGIRFDHRASAIKPEWLPVLDEAVSRIQQVPDAMILVEAHADDGGNEEYNQLLSEQRARVVVNFLVSKGVSDKRIRAIAYGKLRPLADGRTAEGQAGNRRVDVKIVQ